MYTLGITTIIISLISIVINSLRSTKLNYIVILISLELLFIGVALISIENSIEIDDINGILLAIYILCIAATESAIGLTILVTQKRK